MTLADDYERWFANGERPLSAFLEDGEYSPEQIRELTLTDLFLRNQAGLSVEPQVYLDEIPVVAGDRTFVVELYLEAFGYEEEQGVAANVFLRRVPDELHAEIAEQIQVDSVPNADSAAENATPPDLDRYRIDGELGRGSFGIVYRAWDRQLERAVSLKVSYLARESQNEIAEAKLIASLEHPGIVPVYDCGIDGFGRAYFVSTVIEGRDLSAWATAEPKPTTSEVCELFIKLCDALQVAHRHGVVHRDLKPSNLVVRDNGDPVLLDFGLALRDWQPGRQGELVGTPAYMSPEQARGEGHLVDARSDVFSVGVLLFEALSGKRPWQSESSRELIREIAHGSVRSVRELDASLPIELERICSKATATTMAGRYGTVELLSDDLRWFLEQSNLKNREVVPASGIQSRGLRPYTDEDAGSFWELLPGQRDAKGTPDMVNWWLQRLNKEEEPRGVLVLYGPSGSGKSSLLHAGVLPFLDRAVTRVIHLDASEHRTSRQIAKRLAEKTKFTEETPNGLAEFLSAIRRRSAKRLLIVVDQFEQTLAEADDDESEAIAMALRQANGTNLQFVLVVRDEFWSLMSRLMRAIDAPLRDGITAMGLERFSERHARLVLKAWANSLHSDQPPLSEPFLDRAIALVGEAGQVIPVRLALLATMLGDEIWTNEVLERFAGRGPLSTQYLESTLGVGAPASRKRFLSHAVGLLRHLTPASGKIRGPAYSSQELQVASGLQEQPNEFDDLIDLLDRQLHLITPAQSTESNQFASGSERSFQLTHDFLVTEIRRWLEMTERETVRGRATADLRAAAARWQGDTRRANLAGPIESLRFGLLGNDGSSESNIEFIRQSARLHLLRFLTFSMVAIAVAVGGWYLLKRTVARGMVDRIADASAVQLSDVIDEAHDQAYWVNPMLRRVVDEPGQLQDRAALALLREDSSYSHRLVERLPTMKPEMLAVVLNRFAKDLDEKSMLATVEQMADQVTAPEQLPQNRLRFAVGLAALSPQHESLQGSAASLAQLLTEADPTKLGWLVQGLTPIREQLTPKLTAIYQDSLDAQRRRTASYVLAEYAADDPKSLVDLLFGASRDQLLAISPAIQEAGPAVLPILRDRWQQEVNALGSRMPRTEQGASSDTPRDGRRNEPVLMQMQQRVAVARGLGNLGAMMLQLGEGTQILPFLHRSPDPTIRNYLIENYAASGGAAEPIENQLQVAMQSEQLSLAAALTQILGSMPRSTFLSKDVEMMIANAYATESDIEFHGSAEWFLRQRGKLDLAQQSLREQDKPRSWYVTSEQHTMVRLPGPAVYTAGSPTNEADRLENERQHEVSIPEGVFLSTHEVSVGQFQRFLVARGDQSKTSDGDVMSPNDPMLRVSWYEAAEYCNWLSEQDGVNESQFAYLPNERGEFAAGMRVADDHLQRSGYQLPTPDFWEYACRAGTATPRPYGQGIDLAVAYMRTVETPKQADRTIGILKPNAFGLFDMLGGASEWTAGLVIPPQRFPGRRPPGQFVPGSGPETVDPAGQNVTDRRRLLHLGGSLASQAKMTRSAARSKVASPNTTDQPIGIRLMRIMPAE